MSPRQRSLFPSHCLFLVLLSKITIYSCTYVAKLSYAAPRHALYALSRCGGLPILCNFPVTEYTHVALKSFYLSSVWSVFALDSILSVGWAVICCQVGDFWWIFSRMHCQKSISLHNLNVPFLDHILALWHFTYPGEIHYDKETWFFGPISQRIHAIPQTV